MKRAMLSHASIFAAALALLRRSSDATEFAHTLTRLANKSSLPSTAVPQANWLLLAARLGYWHTRESVVASSAALPSRAEVELQRAVAHVGARAALDTHDFNKRHLRLDGAAAAPFDVRAHINSVFVDDASLAQLNARVPAQSFDGVLAAPPPMRVELAKPLAPPPVVPPQELTLGAFAQPTSFVLSTFNYNDVERRAAERRATLASAVVSADEAGTVVSTVAQLLPHSTGASSGVGAATASNGISRSELDRTVAFLARVQTALADKPAELDRFFRTLEEYQRNQSATIADSSQQLHELLLVNKQPQLATELLTYLPSQNSSSSSSGISGVSLAPPATHQPAPRAVADPAIDFYATSQASKIAFFAASQPRTAALLPTADAFQSDALQRQQNVVFAAPTLTSGALGGVPDGVDVAVARDARRKALIALGEPTRSVRETAALFVRAAARFTSGDIDRRFLELMREHCGGALDRAQVVARLRELFAESNDVERGEGEQMMAAFDRVRAASIKV